MSISFELGKKGEQLAKEFLIKNHFNILESNWHFSHKEVDIIAQKDDFLIIVEVKTRSTDYFGEPFEAVDNQKQLFLIEAANGYLETKDLDLEVRFDIVSIVLNKGQKAKITHIPNAFEPKVQ